MKIEKINLIRIILVVPCIALKLPLNNIIGIENCLHCINVFQRLVFEIVTVFGLIYIVGFFEYNLLKFLCPSLFGQLKEALTKARVLPRNKPE